MEKWCKKMKNILIHLDETEYDLLCLARGDENKSWKDHFLDTARDRIRLNEAAVEMLNDETIITGRLVIGDTVIE